MWCHDERGRITTQNRPMAQPAPRLVASRSAAGVVWRTSPAVTPEQVADLRRVVVDEGDWRADQPVNLDAILDVLGGGEIDGGPNFRPTAAMAEPTGDTVVVTAATIDVLGPLMGDWQVDVGTRDPVVAAVVDGRAVAVCMSARLGPEVHEAGVETHRDHRTQGHGLAAVAAWRVAVESLGAIPLYCTDWTNTASQRLARAAGFEHYSTDLYVL